jgi:hypothetical protein
LLLEIIARVLSAKQVGERFLLTCMVIDELKVAVKITVNNVTEELAEIKSGCTISATGPLKFNGKDFLQVNLHDEVFSQVPSAI